MDDTCCIIQRDAVEPLLHHLNEVRPTIKFTMELEKDGSLPFLDTSLTRREDGTLNVNVFRKGTHTDRYLHFNSHHPASAKRAAVRSLFDRARNVHHITEGGAAEGRGTPHHYFQTKRLSLTIHTCHLLLHTETICTTRGGAG